MKLKTNRNSNNTYHDNVNFEPIEAQVRKMLENYYDVVDFRAAGGHLKFICDGMDIHMRLMERTFELMFNAPLSGGAITKEISHTVIEYNKTCDKQLDDFVKITNRLNEKYVKLEEIIGDLLDKRKANKIEKRANEFLRKFFKSDLFEPRFKFFVENMLHKDESFNYFTIYLKANEKYLGDREPSSDIPIGFDGKIMEVHPYNGRNVFEDCQWRLLPSKHAKAGSEQLSLNLKDFKYVIGELEKLEKRMQDFNAFEDENMGKIIQTNKDCYEVMQEYANIAAQEREDRYSSRNKKRI